jgi:hypothetical protein
MRVHSGTVAIARGIGVPFDGGVVVPGIDGVITLHSREMEKSELLPLLEVVLPSSVESSRMVCSDGNPL